MRGLQCMKPEVLDPLKTAIDTIHHVVAATPTCSWGESTVNYILSQYAELEVLFADADVMYNNIAAWVCMRKESWLKLATALYSDYNPIDNYNRTENWTEHETSNADGNNSGDDVNYETAYDSLTEKETDKGHTQTTAHSESERNHTRTGTTSGNIGVTTTQQMIQQEIELRKFDFCKYVAEEFKSEFLLGNY